MENIITQIEEEFEKKVFDPLIHTKDGKTWLEKEQVKSFLTKSNLRVIEKVKTRILSGMKPYTIKADKSVRVADLTTEQFESIVNNEEFLCEDESDLSTLIEQK